MNDLLRDGRLAEKTRARTCIQILFDSRAAERGKPSLLVSRKLALHRFRCTNNIDSLQFDLKQNAPRQGISQSKRDEITCGRALPMRKSASISNRHHAAILNPKSRRDAGATTPGPHPQPATKQAARGNTPAVCAPKGSAGPPPL